MFEPIEERYLKNWVADAQLKRYVILGTITQERTNEIKELKV